MSTEMKPNPESLMAFQSFPYTSRKIQDGQCFIIVTIFLFCFSLSDAKIQTSEGVSSAPLPPPESLFGPPPPLETTTGGSPGPQDPIGGSSNLLAPVSSSTMSYVNHSHATYYPTDLYSGYPVASVFSAAGAQKTALQPTRQRTKARSNAGNLRPDLLTCYYCTK